MNKVGIIGQGHVGATTALVMAQRGQVGKLVLVDKNMKKAQSEQLDLQDQIALLPNDMTIEIQDYQAENWSQLSDLDALVFCPGKISALLDHGGERDYELGLTSQMVHEIAPKIKASGFNGVIVTITNPCDVIAKLLQEETGLAPQKIIGTGIGLETARMHRVVGKATHHNPHDVSGYVLGEHGDTLFVAWSSVKVAGQELSNWTLDLPQLTHDTANGGYEIFFGKEYTNNGIATIVNQIVEAVLTDAQVAMPVSSYDAQNDIYIGQVAVVGQTGVSAIVPVPLNESEQQAYQKSVAAIKANYAKV